MNSMVINHCGFFIYLDLRYLCSFHNVNIMCGLNCTKIVTNFLYIQMNILSTCLVTQVIWRKRCSLCITWETWIVLGNDLNVFSVFNKMHACYIIKSGVGDWGVKTQMEAFNGKIDSKKGKYIPFFHAKIIQINYLHKHHMDFTYKIINN